MAKKKPELQEIINRLDQYREQLHNDPKVGSRKFDHMQTALHWAKQLVRDCYGEKRETGAIAWVK